MPAQRFSQSLSLSLDSPSPSQISAQLERIIASPEFCVPERNRSFLRYVVNETIAGRSAALKAYCIAIEVFARSEDFDAQNDPVVRIEAARLRRALERYYLVAGGADEILIDIPKGAYRPTFIVRRRIGAAVPGPADEPLRTVAPPHERRRRFQWLAGRWPLW